MAIWLQPDHKYRHGIGFGSPSSHSMFLSYNVFELPIIKNRSAQTSDSKTICNSDKFQSIKTIKNELNPRTIS